MNMQKKSKESNEFVYVETEEIDDSLESRRGRWVYYLLKITIGILVLKVINAAVPFLKAM